MTEKTVVRLLKKSGDLYVPSDEEYGGLLIHRYRDGDCDTIGFPLEKGTEHKLASALYAEMMCSDLPEDAVIELPDGEVFNVYDHLR